ncbi:uncharacterized protein LOC119765021 [Culex quinquefasciatus]|uniref:uncharacterized protein LOC119765021 n=1 Tax=Culex quinquefasciatus TaxID=7176 RepID=UPI0018E37286|nr:uncharacterized protein LOC119765021 [Culex quinquefasciatus]
MKFNGSMMSATMVRGNAMSVSGKPKSAAESVSQQQSPDSQQVPRQRTPTRTHVHRSVIWTLAPVPPPNTAAIHSLPASYECARACQEEEPPRICYYFTVEYYIVLGAAGRQEVGRSDRSASSLDGLSRIEGVDEVLVISATNRHALDPALRRIGRFDQEILLGIPDLEAVCVV